MARHLDDEAMGGEMGMISWDEEGERGFGMEVKDKEKTCQNRYNYSSMGK